LLRSYGDFAIAALNVKDAVTGVALGENGFALSVFCEALSLTYRFEKGLKLETPHQAPIGRWPIIPASEPHWAQIEARDPFRDRNEDGERQDAWCIAHMMRQLNVRYWH
jgi:hypothetical protein